MTLTKEDQQQLKKLILPLLDDLHRLAYYLCHNEDDAEDLVAETVRKACEKFHSLKDHAKVKPWLIRILRNTFVSFCRVQQRFTTLDYDFDDEGETDDEVFSLFTEVSQPFLLWWGNPEQELLNKLLEDDVLKAISELPCKYRFAVVLCDVEGLSYDDISTVLNVPVGTVRSRIARGRSMLQKKLYHHAVERGIIHNRKKGHEHARK